MKYLFLALSMTMAFNAFASSFTIGKSVENIIGIKHQFKTTAGTPCSFVIYKSYDSIQVQYRGADGFELPYTVEENKELDRFGNVSISRANLGNPIDSISISFTQPGRIQSITQRRGLHNETCVVP